ncbi:MAG TPA: Stp1/IreP family PP2C-type Ser/Thr phosphatase [Blastocatellia bacterium]|jgi:protein phosphatase
MFRFWKKSKEAEVFSSEGPEKESYTKLPNYTVVASLLTDPGCQREINEDSISYLKPSDPAKLASKGMLAIVADGMGGHSAGEVASSLAVQTVSLAYYESEGDVRSSLESAFLKANQRIFETSREDDGMRGMGTTCTALVLQNGSAIAAHVGDSRLYLVRDEKIYLMTEDHSAVMEMVKQGLISLEQARHHPDKNVILRALGSKEVVEVTTWTEPFPVREGDIFLLCSDGLYDLVEDEEIKQAVLISDPHTACQRLVALARERGGPDNISVGIVRLIAPGEARNPVPETRELEVKL